MFSMSNPMLVTFLINTFSFKTISHEIGVVFANASLSLLAGVVHYELKKYFYNFITILINVMVT